MKQLMVISLASALAVAGSVEAAADGIGGDFLTPPYAEHVTFSFTEDAASNLVRAVVAFQVPGNTTNDWTAIGSGFFVLGTNDVALCVTCAHVVAAAARLKKDLYIGANVKGEYRRFRSHILYTRSHLINGPKPL